jgi:excisionase family DNA binding protein
MTTWIGVGPAMQMTGLSRTRIHSMAEAGEIPAYRVRRTLRFKSEELTQWIEAQRIVPTKETI